jgi:transcriptional regulator with XRE-family HTH domain
MNQTGLPDTDRIDPTIGERLMVIRRRCGISQVALARAAGMSPTVVNRLERGLQCITAERLATLARLLNVDANYLLGLRHEPQPLTLDDTPPQPAPRPGRRPATVG